MTITGMTPKRGISEFFLAAAVCKKTAVPKTAVQKTDNTAEEKQKHRDKKAQAREKRVRYAAENRVFFDALPYDTSREYKYMPRKRKEIRHSQPYVSDKTEACAPKREKKTFIPSEAK